MPPQLARGSLLPRWGAALRQQNDDAVVRCRSCDVAGTVDLPKGAGLIEDRAHWPSIRCFFTVGCRGTIGPEPLN